jgi:hypothetical protein
MLKTEITPKTILKITLIKTLTLLKIKPTLTPNKKTIRYVQITQPNNKKSIKNANIIYSSISI